MQKEYAQIHRDIIDRCRDGDRQAQHQLYRLYAAPMLTVSMRILHNRQEAEDILQEAFLDMFIKLDSFRGESSFGAWFKRIVVNKSINSFKKKRLVTTDLDHQPEVVETDEAGEEPFPYNVKQVQSALDKLPEGYRLVFTLYLLEGYTHQEIAAELGITESTSKSQFNRSKKKIRSLLQEMYP